MESKTASVLWLLLLLALMESSGCATRPRLYDVPEVKLNQIHAGKDSQADVRRLLGEPPFADGDQWNYPIQFIPSPFSWGTPTLLPAVQLKVRFDQEDHVSEWGFYHPITDKRLIVDDPSGYLANGLIDLPVLLSHGRTKSEVIAVFRYHFDSMLR